MAHAVYTPIYIRHDTQDKLDTEFKNIEQTLLSISSSGTQGAAGANGTSGGNNLGITIGTTSANGANVVSTTSAGFDSAIALLGGQSNSSSGTIYLQAGEYAPLRVTTIPAGITLQFLPGAVIKWDQTIPWAGVFSVSGTINDAVIDITTTTVVDFNIDSPTSIFNMFGHGIVNRPYIKNFNFTLPAANTLFGYLARFDQRAKDASIFDLYAPSVTISGGDYQCSAFIILGSSYSQIVRPYVRTVYVGSIQNNRPLIYMGAGTYGGAESFKIRDGFFDVQERLFWFGDTGANNTTRLKNFSFENNTVYSVNNYHNPMGFFVFDALTVNVSTGNMVRNNSFTSLSATSFPLISVNMGNPTANFTGLIISGNTFQFPDGSSGPCIQTGTTGGKAAISTVILGNVCNGTSTFLTDGGSNTSSAGNRNILNGTPQ